MMTGTVIASAIPMLVSPALTRLYSPEEYGVFAGFVLAATTLASFASARFELAIVQADDSEQAFDVVGLCALLAVAVCVLSGLLVALSGPSVLRVLTSTRLGRWVVLLPVMAFLMSLFQTANYWLLRLQAFSVLSSSRVARAVVIATANISFGLLHVDGGLIISSMLGQALLTGLLSAHLLRSAPKPIRAIKWSSMVALAKRHRGFAMYALPADLMSTYAGQLPLIMLDSAAAGAYSFVLLVVGAPLSVVSGSVLDAFKDRATREYREKGEFHRLFATIAKSLALIGAVPFGVLLFWGSPIFALVFGEKWRVAGGMAQLLAGMFFLKMIVSPLSYTYYIVEKQREDFALHVLVLIGAFASLHVGLHFLRDARWAVGLFSASYSLAYAVYFVRSRSFSKGVHIDVVNSQADDQEVSSAQRVGQSLDRHAHNPDSDAP